MRHSQNGSVASVGALVFLTIALVGALVFASWAYKGRQDYKNNSDQKAITAAYAATKIQAAELQKAFALQESRPTKTYKGSTTYGTVTFDYPKTWSGYVDESTANEPINGYFYPGIVPGLQSKTAYALRVELVVTDYTSILQQHDSQVKDGSVKASAYVPLKMVGVANVQPGTRLDGALDQNTRGSMVIIKVRDKTLQIYTESNDFLSDFNNTILASLTFAP
ncbi:hypothetical protein BVY00_00890 [bacterium G20]|nr:hypothetical protein BVY00_00890 [bacterium G20]